MYVGIEECKAMLFNSNIQHLCIIRVRHVPRLISQSPLYRYCHLSSPHRDAKQESGVWQCVHIPAELIASCEQWLTVAVFAKVEIFGCYKNLSRGADEEVKQKDHKSLLYCPKTMSECVLNPYTFSFDHSANEIEIPFGHIRYTSFVTLSSQVFAEFPMAARFPIVHMAGFAAISCRGKRRVV